MTNINISSHPEYDAAIQRYSDFMNKVEIGQLPYVSKERIAKNFEKYGQAMNTLMMYPDILSDIMTPKKSTFSMFFEQRMVIRAMARYRQGFFTFTRGFSKSFLAFYQQFTACMFVPRLRTFVVGGTKAQAAQIAREKVIDDLWVKFPLLANEMKKFKVAGKLKTPYINSGDSVEFHFTHGSIFDVIGGQVRGARRHRGLFEEVITLDQTYINESVLPTLNTTRTNHRNEINPKEPQAQKIFITSAGFIGTFAHDKLVETFCMSLLEPDKYIVMGGSYDVLVMHGRLAESTIREYASSSSYKADSFDREYRSIWSMTVDGAVFQTSTVAALRKMKRAEYKGRDFDINDKSFYVVSADLAYDGNADTAVIVIKVTPGDYNFSYRFVNLFTINVANYETVANILKQTCMQYNARLLVYDANGIGAAIREHLNKPSATTGGLKLPAYGIINPPSNVEDQLRKIKDKSLNICYEIKSGGQKGSEIHGVFLGKIPFIRLLVKSSEALKHFEKQKGFALASSAVKERYMRPFRYTDLLQTELENLDFKQDVANEKMIRVTRRNDKIQKDFFSAAEYGVYAVVQEIEIAYYKKKHNHKIKSYSLAASNSNERINNRRRSGRNLDNRRRSRR